MNFTLSKSTISEVLSKVGKVLSAKSNIPVLSGLYIKATENEISFMASDSETTVAYRVLTSEPNVTVQAVGETVIPKEAFNTINKLQGLINFDLNEDKSTVKVIQVNDNFKLSFQTFFATDYPEMSEMPKNSYSVQINSDKFKRLINETAHCAATVDTRPILKSINISVKSKSIEAVSTDSHRLARIIDQSFSSNLSDEEVISLPIPADMLVTMAKTFTADSDVYLLFSSNRFAAMNGNIVFTSSLYSGDYPMTDRLIPDGLVTSVELNRSELLLTLNILSDMTASSLVSIKFDPMFATIESVGSVSKGLRELIHSKLEGDTSLTLSFNALFLKQSLLVLENENVVIEFYGNNKPFLIKESHNNFDSLHLLLPVRSY